MPYILALQNVYPFKDILRQFLKSTFFVVKWNLGDSSSCYCENILLSKVSRFLYSTVKYSQVK